MGKLRMALDAEKGKDRKKIAELRKAKAKTKARHGQKVNKSENPGETQNRTKSSEKDDNDWEDISGHDKENDVSTGVPLETVSQDDESEDEEDDWVDAERIDESDSDSEVEMEERIPRKPKSKPPAVNGKAFGAEKNVAKNVTKNVTISVTKKGDEEGAEEGAEEDEEDEEDEEANDIPLSDLEDLPDEDKEDLIPHQRSTINNTKALNTILDRFCIPTDDSVSFESHLSVVSNKPTADAVDDINDDIKRELAFYAQAKAAALEGRGRLLKEGVPFTRPGDYFAEMVKNDGHMERVKAKLIEQATNKKAAAEARKLRDLKKFGKQVQVAKLQERAKVKRETLDKIKLLKKKRSDTGGAGLDTHEADMFDVGVEKELSGKSRKRGPPGSSSFQPNPKRQRKDEKYGFGGKKRHSKSGDAISSGDVSGFSNSTRKGKKRSVPAAKQRPGKARRKAIARKK